MKILTKDYNLAIKFPDIAKGFHPTKNVDKNGKILTPFDLLPKSSYKAWWICPICNQDYIAKIANRTNCNSGCSFCSGKNVSYNYNLGTEFPEIAVQWHPTLNGNLKPENFLPFSNKKAWWRCNYCYHVWQISIANRTYNKSGCPNCGGRIPTKNYSLAVKFPELLKEWNWEENNKLGLDPYNITPFSKISPCWKCPTCNHTWSTTIGNRTGTGKTNCPNCWKNKDKTGANSCNWIDGRSYFPYLPEFNKVLKLKIRTRDNFICQLCGMTEEESIIKSNRVLAVNHIDFNQWNNNSINLNTLCISCNSKINYNREYYTWLFQTKLRYNYLWKCND
jgi:hypothetical protein